MIDQLKVHPCSLDEVKAGRRLAKGRFEKCLNMSITKGHGRVGDRRLKARFSCTWDGANSWKYALKRLSYLTVKRHLSTCNHPKNASGPAALAALPNRDRAPEANPPRPPPPPPGGAFGGGLSKSEGSVLTDTKMMIPWKEDEYLHLSFGAIEIIGIIIPRPPRPGSLGIPGSFGIPGTLGMPGPPPGGFAPGDAPPGGPPPGGPPLGAPPPGGPPLGAPPPGAPPAGGAPPPGGPPAGGAPPPAPWPLCPPLGGMP
ncbi:hypothetical protein M514_01904 [Trichuris suis]|uniref:Uncharacterized protein n=1 Tax=Trichuris suis TaxID=68888 RepID=A0A085NTI6_9BILA|nr:hypothetical protein M514_01904 [Trichuris suis]